MACVGPAATETTSDAPDEEYPRSSSGKNVKARWRVLLQLCGADLIG